MKSKVSKVSVDIYQHQKDRFKNVVNDNNF